jgi:hypothetical protein
MVQCYVQIGTEYLIKDSVIVLTEGKALVTVALLRTSSNIEIGTFSPDSQNNGTIARSFWCEYSRAQILYLSIIIKMLEI